MMASRPKITRPATQWVLVIFLWIAGLAAAMQFAKLSVSLAWIAREYEIDVASASLLFSCVGLVGVFFGGMVGEIVAAIGTRRALLIGLAAGTILSVFEAFLPPIWVFFPLRLFEGAAHLLIVVAAPTAIIAASAERHQRFSMALWATFFGVAYAIAGAVGEPILQAAGLRGLFLGHAATVGLSLILIYILQPPESGDRSTGWKPSLLREAAKSQLSAYCAPHTAAPGLTFVWHTLMFIALLTFLPRLAPAKTSHTELAATFPMLSIAGSFVGGVIAQRIPRPFLLTGSSFLALGISNAILYGLVGSTYVVDAAYIVVFLAGVTQALCFALVPLLCKTPADWARGNATIAQLGSLGASLGTPIFAWAISTYSIYAAPIVASLFSAAGLVTAVVLFYWLRMRTGVVPFRQATRYLESDRF
jgi:AAHS family 3-hydroxyphenylpropionic acid transporter